MSVVYLYGFVPERAALPDGGLLGVGDAPVELVALDGFAAAIGRPDPALYAAAPLEARSTDMAWMAEQGLRHEQVVAWFVDHSTILPSRLLTLFSSDDALRQAVRERGGIAAELERFAGTREWDLKVGWDAAVLAEHLGEVSEDIAALDRDIAAATPGKRFLLQRKRDDLARTEGRAVARRLATELLEELRARARDSVILPPPPDGSPIVLNAALLIPAAVEADALERAATARDRLAGLGVTVAFTGPWAPYRFTERADE
ncbi:MAG TPA: GvpL/GvpF family gas vesicle protein [Longimicrobiales bacterium]|nr:GvpL/GvpF family gas vesicle protein [Longimicrobiales bacterium]